MKSYKFVTKKRLLKEAARLIASSSNGFGDDDKRNNYYWSCGNANALNAICGRFGISATELTTESLKIMQGDKF